MSIGKKKKTNPQSAPAPVKLSRKEQKELEGELEIVTNANEQTYNAVNEILEQFMKENHVEDIHELIGCVHA